MVARVIWSKASPDLTDAWVEVVNAALIPAARTQEGYRGYIALYDREEGVSISVTLWENDETERASELAARAGREEMARAVNAEMRVDRYEVAAVDIVK